MCVSDKQKLTERIPLTEPLNIAAPRRAIINPVSDFNLRQLKGDISCTNNIRKACILLSELPESRNPPKLALYKTFAYESHVVIGEYVKILTRRDRTGKSEMVNVQESPDINAVKVETGEIRGCRKLNRLSLT
ncbi:hypothetical protein QE152_g21895 [Popillia japonica]|uniref:Uncharacterized protein n=1 Tax=Popillia japonica TaxID=7064 RepID=A0AAW1KLV9_POPJA